MVVIMFIPQSFTIDDTSDSSYYDDGDEGDDNTQ